MSEGREYGLRPTKEHGRGVWLDEAGRALRVPREWPSVWIMCDLDAMTERGRHRRAGKPERLFRVTRLDLAGPFSAEAEAWWIGNFGDLPPAEVADRIGPRLWHLEGKPHGKNWRNTADVEGKPLEEDERAGYVPSRTVGWRNLGVVYSHCYDGPDWERIETGEYWRNTYSRESHADARGLAQALFVPEFMEAMGYYNGARFLCESRARIVPPVTLLRSPDSWDDGFVGWTVPA